LYLHNKPLIPALIRGRELEQIQGLWVLRQEGEEEEEGLGEVRRVEEVEEVQPAQLEELLQLEQEEEDEEDVVTEPLQVQSLLLLLPFLPSLPVPQLSQPQAAVPDLQQIPHQVRSSFWYVLMAIASPSSSDGVKVLSFSGVGVASLLAVAGAIFAAALY